MLRHIARAARQGGAEIDRQASELTFVARTPESPDEMRHKAFADSFDSSRRQQFDHQNGVPVEDIHLTSCL